LPNAHHVLGGKSGVRIMNACGLFDDVTCTLKQITIQAARDKQGTVGRRQVAQRLSIGQKTVLALAFRVAVNAMFAEEIGLLALDEPTASLDQPRIQALAPVLEKLRDLSTAKGLQCLLVTHAANLSHLFESTIELEAPELRHGTRVG
jgi:DNA repair exonuclease SbcCD ATPase subunit